MYIFTVQTHAHGITQKNQEHTVEDDEPDMHRKQCL